MPEQQSARGQEITAAPITSPPQTEIWPYGLGGVNLKDQLDKLPPGQFAIHTNLTHTMDRGATVRPGLTSLATGGTTHHSVRRLSDPQNSTYTRIWGIDQSIYLGQSGALTALEAGFSGNPITLVPHRPPLSGDPWMFVGDSSKMRKVRVDGLVLPIGLPAPAAVPTVALGTRNLTQIANFDIGSDTDPAHWVSNYGTTFDSPQTTPPTPSGQPSVSALTSPDSDDTAAIYFERLAATSTPTGDYVYFGVDLSANPRDLSLVGTQPADDNDYIHLWLNFSHPSLITEFRLYLVCSSNFDATVLPGLEAARNSDAYVKGFSGNDFAQFIQAEASQTAAAEAARVRNIRNQSLQDYATNPQRVATENTVALTDPLRTVTLQAPSAADQWLEYGVLGVTLRRGDFQRIGTTVGAGWSTITGIVCYMQTGANSGPGPVAVRLGNLYLHGGASPDTGEAGLQSYDYRTTDYDPRTGAESNPGPVMAVTNWIDTLRRTVLITPPAAGSGALRQRVYRRGGTNIADWYYLGTTASNGGVFTDTLSDDDAGGANTLDTDRYQPVPTVDDAGNTILAQPLPVLFGPAAGMLFALGDPYRPGHLYFSVPDSPDHWSAFGNVEVCAPSEELMAGGMYGSQPFCFSRERLYSVYPNLGGSSTSVSVTTTACRRGIVSRTAMVVGPMGIYGVSKDAVFRTSGGQEEVISLDIQTLFRDQTWNGYAAIDFAFPEKVRLGISQDLLYLTYQDTLGAIVTMVYSILFNFWTAYTFGKGITTLHADDDAADALTIVGGSGTGASYSHSGYSDAGTAIPFTLRTGDWDLGRPREDKLLFDQILDADLQGCTVTLQNRLNSSTTVNDAQSLDISTGRQRYTLDSFGTTPQRARTVSTEIVGTSSTTRPTFYFLGISHLPEPDQTLNRMTQWDDLNHPDEKWVTGVTFDCDTGGTDRTIYIEGDVNGAISTLATLTVNANGRHKLAFSWVGLGVHKVRIRPDGTCVPWILYRADWIALPEPPRIATWDSFFEAAGDQYYTGLDLYCDTNGAEKQIQVEVDGSVLTNPYTAEAFWRVTTTGRTYVHLTFLAGRGHVFRFRALDTNPGLLYTHKWWMEQEPSEQANWNQPYSVEGTLADKWFKAFLFEVDTFGATKTVTIEVDGVVVDTLSVTTIGRKVVHLTLTTQQLGRVLRVYPTDGNPSRPYTIIPIFDVEPYKLNRWETQETDHGEPDFHTLLDMHVTLRSTAVVTLTLSIYINQLGTIITDTYEIPSTGGVKDKRYVSFLARKGVLYKYLFTSPADFHLFQEESSVQIQPWGGDQIVRVKPWGNDDQDATRNMVVAKLAAARSGGGA